MTPETYVITCNDSVEHIVIGTEGEANDKLTELAHKYYDVNKSHWQNSAREAGKSANPYEYYRSRTHWAARPTPHTCGNGVAIFEP